MTAEPQHTNVGQDNKNNNNTREGVAPAAAGGEAQPTFQPKVKSR